MLAVEAAASGVAGDFVVATDARRKEVHPAAYGASGTRTSGPVVDKPAELGTRLPAVGEGAALYPDHFANAVGPARPSAGWLARCIAEQRAELTAPEPLYLRRPDAQLPNAPKRVS